MPYLSPQAIIPEAKLTKYLLIWKPKNDKSGFLAQAGYTIDNWQELSKDLKTLLVNESSYHKSSNFGDIYEIKGVLPGRNGISLNVATYWIIDSLTKETRFVILLPN
jgi:hypothetical protein